MLDTGKKSGLSSIEKREHNQMRRLGIYISILVFLITFYYLYEIRRQKGGVQEKERLFGLNSEAVGKLVLENHYGHFEFTKRGKKWWINRPIEDFADEHIVSGIIEGLVSTTIEKEISPLPHDLSPYGLNRPSFKITIFSGKKTHFLSLGEDTPNHAHIYGITKGRDAIYLLPIRLKYALNKDISEFRDKVILDFDPQRVKRVLLNWPQAKAVLVKEKSWQILAPFKEAADGDEVESLLYHIQAGRALNFVKTPFKPIINIELWTERQKGPLWLKIGKRDKVYVKSSYHPDEMVVEDAFLKRLPKSALVFKRRYIFGFDIESISKIEIRFNNKRVIAKKDKEKKWEITPSNLAKDYEIEFFLSDLKNLKYLPENVPRPKNFPLALADIKLWNENGKQILEAKYFKGDKEASWIRTNGKLYPIKASFFESFPERLKGGKDGKNHS